jgi:hypothetical protein
MVMPGDVDVVTVRRGLLLLGDRRAQRRVDARDAGDARAEQQAAEKQHHDGDADAEAAHGGQSTRAA